MNGQSLLSAFGARKRTPEQWARSLLGDLFEKNQFEAHSIALSDITEKCISRKKWRPLFKKYPPRLAEDRVVAVYRFMVTPPFRYRGEPLLDRLPKQKGQTGRLFGLCLRFGVSKPLFPAAGPPTILEWPDDPNVVLGNWIGQCSAQYVYRKLVDLHRIKAVAVGSLAGVTVQAPSVQHGREWRADLRGAALNEMINEIVEIDAKSATTKHLINLFAE